MKMICYAADRRWVDSSVLGGADPVSFELAKPMFSNRIAYHIVIVLVLAGGPVAYADLTIMPFGDSITNGYHGVGAERGSYRLELEKFLSAIDFDFDFVGDRRVAQNGLLDGDVQAMGGYTVESMRDEFASAVELYRPDVVLVLAGTNNHWDDPSTTDYASKYFSLINMIGLRSPESRLVVSTVPEFGCCRDVPYWTNDWVEERNEVRFPAMNAALFALAAADARVSVVDYYSELDPATDLVVGDWVHPNQSGQAKLANLYLMALLSQDYGLIRPAHIDGFMQAIEDDSNTVLDLDGSGSLDPEDVAVFLRDFVRTTRGDANLDGRFSSRDFVQVFQSGHYEDTIVGNSTWATGDWNGDREFTTQDLIAVFQDGRYELSTLESSAVPEPGSGLLAMFGIFVLAQCHRLRHSSAFGHSRGDRSRRHVAWREP